VEKMTTDEIGTKNGNGNGDKKNIVIAITSAQKEIVQEVSDALGISVNDAFMQIIGISTESINEAFANYDIKELVKRSLASKAKKYGIDLKALEL